MVDHEAADPASEPPPLAYENSDGLRPAGVAPTEDRLEGRRHDPYAALRVPAFLLYSSGFVLSVAGQQMLSVAVGWELYQRTRSALALGMVGLVQALPIVVLALPAGHLADRVSRRKIVCATQGLTAGFSALLAWHVAEFSAVAVHAGAHRGIRQYLRGGAAYFGAGARTRCHAGTCKCGQ